MNIAFVTCQMNPDLWSDDALALPFLEGKATWKAIPWDDPNVDWTSFDRVIIRGTWDYHQRLPEFRAWLKKCSENGVNLHNDAETVQWNMDKTYLQSLENQGVVIPPTIWLNKGDTVNLSKILADNRWQKAVIKPTVSLGAYNTWVVTAETAKADSIKAQKLLKEGAALMVQPFLDNILEEGEWSLVFFSNRFSHALLKRPKSGDFRVQHIHGGSMTPAKAPAKIISTAREILHKLPIVPLYARVDGVRAGKEFLLMELELIEPVLYLSQDEKAPERWAKALMKIYGIENIGKKK